MWYYDKQRSKKHVQASILWVKIIKYWGYFGRKDVIIVIRLQRITLYSSFRWQS